jgi:integrase
VGKPLHPSNFLQRSFYPLLEQAGLPRIRIHDLRHSAATLLLGLASTPRS